jgi:two-component system secretion sensor histidine kinase SsrA
MALMARVRASLLEYHERIATTLEQGQREASLEWLHAFKGLAGQAGFDLLCEAAAHCEQRLQAGDLSGEKEWASLRVLIEATVLPSEAAETFSQQ